MTSDVFYGPARSWQNFALFRLRPSQDSEAVGRQPRISYNFVLDNVSDKNYELLYSVKAHVA